MKRFLINITKIIAFVFIIQVVLIVVVLAIEKSYSFRVSDSINKVIIGHSMTECAIDDNIYKGSINVSQSGTGLNYSYVKLRKILNENPQIDTVILGLKPNDFLEKHGDGLTSLIINEKVPKYFFLFEMNEINEFVVYPSFYSALCKIPFDYIINFSKTFYSSYSIGDYGIGKFKSKLGSHLPNKNLVSYDINDSSEINVYFHSYLLKMNDLCNTQNVRLVCITTPMYSSSNNPLFCQFMMKNHIDYHDFSDYQLPTSYFLDFIHLNANGSKLFSNDLDSLFYLKSIQ